jgi:Fic family protein
MDLLSANAASNGDEQDAHKICSHRYAELQSRYDLKNIEMIGHKTKASYWEAQFRQLKTREEELISEVDELKAKLRKREQELFGKSSEKNNKNPATTTSKRIVEKCNLTLPTIIKSLNHLIDLGIVSEVTGKARNKVYVYKKYLDILSKGTTPIRK